MIQKNKKDFLEKRIKKFDRKIFHLILIEIINICLNKNHNDNNTGEEEEEKEKDEEKKKIKKILME